MRYGVYLNLSPLLPSLLHYSYCYVTPSISTSSVLTSSLSLLLSPFLPLPQTLSYSLSLLSLSLPFPLPLPLPSLPLPLPSLPLSLPSLLLSLSPSLSLPPLSSSTLSFFLTLLLDQSCPSHSSSHSLSLSVLRNVQLVDSE